MNLECAFAEKKQSATDENDIPARNFFADNRPAIKMIEFLRHDLKELKIKTFGFFEQYGYGNPLEQGRNFPRDLRWYMQLISDRFSVEEDYLVPLLKRMSEESGSSLVNIV